MGAASIYPLNFVRTCCHTVGQGKRTQKLPGFQEPLGGGNDISPRDERRLASATKRRSSSARKKTVTSPRNAAPGPWPAPLPEWRHPRRGPGKTAACSWKRPARFQPSPVSGAGPQLGALGHSDLFDRHIRLVSYLRRNIIAPLFRPAEVSAAGRIPWP